MSGARAVDAKAEMLKGAQSLATAPRRARRGA
jgi:hypothetical protein